MVTGPVEQQAVVATAAPPQQPPQQGLSTPQKVAVGGAAAAAAGTAIAATPPAISVGADVAIPVLTAQVVGAFVTFLGALRTQRETWMRANLGGTGATPAEIASVIAGEMVREQEFARKAADRLASRMPEALRIEDPDERRRKVAQILADEERFAAARTEAMVARATAAIERFGLRRASPLGAYWEIGLAHQHTQGCLIMHGKFWPWAVLDRVHPPRHYGCTSRLHTFADAIQLGLMTPADVPDTRAAIRAASGVMMEGEADALLAELEVREQLAELGFDASGIELAGVGVDAFESKGDGDGAD